jgi:hypothetical protein
MAIRLRNREAKVLREMIARGWPYVGELLEHLYRVGRKLHLQRSETLLVYDTSALGNGFNLSFVAKKDQG